MFYDDGYSDPEYAPTGTGSMIIMGYLLAVFVCTILARWTGWVTLVAGFLRYANPRHVRGPTSPIDG